MPHERNTMLAQENIGSLIVKLAAPAIVGLVVQALYNLVDTIFIGRGLGEDSVLGIAGISVAFPVQMLMLAIALGVGVGGASIISRSLGGGKQQIAEKTVGNMATMVTVASLLFTVAGLAFMEELLALFGASAEVMPYAADYTYYILLGTVFFTFSAAMNNSIRAEGNTSFAMLIMVISSVANIVLDPLFIFEFGMGIKGAAIATVISQIIGTIMVFYYYASGKATVPFSLTSLRPDMSIVNESTYIGMSEFLFNVVESGLFLIFNQSLLYYGSDVAIAVFGIIIKVFMLTLMPVIGIKQGIQPIFGFNYGANQMQRVRRTISLSTYLATGLSLIFAIVVFIIPEQIIGVFSNDPVLIEMGVPAIKICYIMMPFIGAQIVATALLQSLGKSKESLLVTLSRQLIFLPPLLIILPMYFGLTGIWLSLPVSDFLAFVVAVIFLQRESKKLEV
ncbi:MATE family efflux transporter [Methanohalophilus portucalensis]|uniref:Multidrug export protein MepA n=2 Tax=Methanohalophilus portucalensis TaxID=39664 RepID=A0A1L9C7C9_9EURY|nr:MATE family efflux transporter [Methanohalophilus portucalensis]ATU08995.1 MATE family efflux transporter [Methanohalophilus portucalensis]OJH50413.1 MATE efflux family protein [Methanohalophilus portucalensis FDF-1]RNI11159.1 MATE family efflux transporter [Methanohalophilus portucalensis FDF-1]SMH29604.1 putative efflux protein, MATE family [Methanohalophilus portucalensis FDF-1]